MFQKLMLSAVVVAFLSACHHTKEVATNDVKNLPKKEANNAIINKYAIQLGVSSKELKNPKLYTAVDEWYAVPYKYAGFDKNGIDCSGLACKLYEAAYGLKISRVSKDIYASCKELEASELKEGDFVFFKIESKNVSHVGIYLSNNKFVHASTKRGVIINDLNEAYYKKYFYKGGRLKTNL
jgi:lipoprotein Spr